MISRQRAVGGQASNAPSLSLLAGVSVVIFDLRCGRYASGLPCLAGGAALWTVYYVYARDIVGNTRTYFAEELATNALPTKLVNMDQALPELVFTNAGAVPGASKGKWSTVSLQALVQNIGNLPASNVRVSFAYSIDGGQTFSNISASRTGTLAPGATGIAEHTWKTNPGEHVVRIAIDPDNRVAEYDETNNSRAFPVTVR